MGGIRITSVMTLLACCFSLSHATQFAQCFTQFEDGFLTKDMFAEVLDTNSPHYCQRLNELIVYVLNEIDPNILSYELQENKKLYQGHLRHILQRYGASCSFTVNTIEQELKAGLINCDTCAQNFRKLGQILDNTPTFCPALQQLMSCLFHEVDFDNMHMYSRDLGKLKKASFKAEAEHLERIFGVKLCPITRSNPYQQQGKKDCAHCGSTSTQAGQLILVSAALLALWGRLDI